MYSWNKWCVWLCWLYKWVGGHITDIANAYILYLNLHNAERMTMTNFLLFTLYLVYTNLRCCCVWFFFDNCWQNNRQFISIWVNLKRIFRMTRPSDWIRHTRTTPHPTKHRLTLNTNTHHIYINFFIINIYIYCTVYTHTHTHSLTHSHTFSFKLLLTRRCSFLVGLRKFTSKTLPR